ncbi:MAG: protein kinase [Bacteroidaceae bacterium]|nr:protein kinase [Bacteroidaceae bacterium]
MESEKKQSLPHGYILQGEENRYVIDRVLGQGSFGITYLAKCRTTFSGSMGTGKSWTQVAIKEFFMRDMNVRDTSNGHVNDMSDDSLSGKYRRAFVREARNLARLDYPGIVNVFEVIESNNTVYIVMEYIDGGNLDEVIASKGRIPESEALNMFREICSAVDFMHHHRMLHLDIKPKNIMLDEDGHPRLIDFGLSKQFTAGGEPESSTTIGLGTPGYAPIEQADRTDNGSTGIFRPTIDIYALGATLYKMLTGITPPPASKVSESALDGEDVISSFLIEQGTRVAIASFVSKAMCPSSRKRYQSVEELVTALDRLLDATTIDDVTLVELPKTTESLPKPDNSPNVKPFPGPDNRTKKSFPKWLYGVIAALLVGVIVYLAIPKSKSMSELIATGTTNGHEWVDLGLSVKWATCNVGASNPEDYGDYYAWGETSTKSSYTLVNYRFRTSGDTYDNVKYSKYNTDSSRGIVDNKSTLDLNDDVARVKWGGSWRMPTNSEFEELIDNCTWTWTTQNGINGYRVTSKKSGYTSRSIFLPAAGGRGDTGLGSAGEYCIYWSSSLIDDSPDFAWFLYFNSDYHDTYNDSRRNGLSVRPVCP